MNKENFKKVLDQIINRPETWNQRERVASWNPTRFLWMGADVI